MIRRIFPLLILTLFDGIAQQTIASLAPFPLSASSSETASDKNSRERDWDGKHRVSNAPPFDPKNNSSEFFSAGGVSPPFEFFIASPSSLSNQQQQKDYYQEEEEDGGEQKRSEGNSKWWWPVPTSFDEDSDQETKVLYPKGISTPLSSTSKTNSVSTTPTPLLSPGNSTTVSPKRVIQITLTVEKELYNAIDNQREWPVAPHTIPLRPRKFYTKNNKKRKKPLPKPAQPSHQQHEVPASLFYSSSAPLEFSSRRQKLEVRHTTQTPSPFLGVPILPQIFRELIDDLLTSNITRQLVLLKQNLTGSSNGSASSIYSRKKQLPQAVSSVLSQTNQTPAEPSTNVIPPQIVPIPAPSSTSSISSALAQLSAVEKRRSSGRFLVAAKKKRRRRMVRSPNRAAEREEPHRRGTGIVVDDGGGEEDEGRDPLEEEEEEEGRRLVESSFDPKCNSERLRDIIRSTVGRDLRSVKRNIQELAERRLGRTHAFHFNVVCADNDFSYIANTEEYCQDIVGQDGQIACFIFSRFQRLPGAPILSPRATPESSNGGRRRGGGKRPPPSLPRRRTTKQLFSGGNENDYENDRH